MNEVTDVTADVFMGMSLQCAQCHDHKFDPLLHKDYYRLQAFLSNITWAEDKPFATQAQIDEYNAKLKIWEEATKEPRAVIDAIVEPRIINAQKSAVTKFPEEIQAMKLPEALFAGNAEMEGVTGLDAERMLVRVAAPARPGKAPDAELALRRAAGEALRGAGLEIR